MATGGAPSSRNEREMQKMKKQEREGEGESEGRKEHPQIMHCYLWKAMKLSSVVCACVPDTCTSPSTT